MKQRLIAFMDDYSRFITRQGKILDFKYIIILKI